MAPPTTPSSIASVRNAQRMLLPLEAERAQRADLRRARRDRGVHGDHGADHRADGKDHRQRDAEVADEIREHLRLLLVEDLLALRLDGESWIGFEPRLQARRRRRGRSTACTIDENMARRNAWIIWSASPQISESKPLPPASNTPTMVQSRSPKRRRSPMATPSKRSAMLLPDDDLGTPRPPGAARDDVHLGPQDEAALARAANHDVRRAAAAALGQGDQHQHLLRDQRTAVEVERHLRLRLDHARLRPIDGALDFGAGRATDDQHVVVGCRWPPESRAAPAPASAPSRTRTPPARGRRWSMQWSAGAPRDCAGCRRRGSSWRRGVRGCNCPAPIPAFPHAARGGRA